MCCNRNWLQVTNSNQYWVDERSLYHGSWSYNGKGCAHCVWFLIEKCHQSPWEFHDKSMRVIMFVTFLSRINLATMSNNHFETNAQHAHNLVVGFVQRILLPWISLTNWWYISVCRILVLLFLLKRMSTNNASYICMIYFVVRRVFMGAKIL